MASMEVDGARARTRRPLSAEDAEDAMGADGEAQNEVEGRGEEDEEGEEEVVIDPEDVERHLRTSDAEQLAAEVLTRSFPPVSASELVGNIKDSRSVAVPPHRFTPLKEQWLKIYTPIVENMKLQIRMNLKSRRVEIRTSEFTDDAGALQKAADFVRAFMMGFDVDDAVALLRMDDLYIDSFEIKDVKTLNGEHLSRAIGRIAGKGGRTKFAIENSTRTRIVLADRIALRCGTLSHIHILGSFQNIRLARDAVVSLILGSPPGKVYSHLRNVSSRMRERF